MLQTQLKFWLYLTAKINKTPNRLKPFLKSGTIENLQKQHFCEENYSTDHNIILTKVYNSKPLKTIEISKVLHVLKQQSLDYRVQTRCATALKAGANLKQSCAAFKVVACLAWTWWWKTYFETDRALLIFYGV